MNTAAVAGLVERAEAGFREDAPPDAAQAREALLAAYRASYASTGHLDRSAGLELDEWNGADLDAIAWVCRLAEAGHVGAIRFADRVLELDGYATHPSPRDAFPRSGPLLARIEELGRRHPKIGLCIAIVAVERGQPSLLPVIAWLEAGAAPFAAAAASLRTLYPDGVVEPVRREHIQAILRSAAR